MKKFSTPYLERQIVVSADASDFAPRLSTIEFIKSFARACQSLPLQSSSPALSSVVLN